MIENNQNQGFLGKVVNIEQGDMGIFRSALDNMIDRAIECQEKLMNGQIQSYAHLNVEMSLVLCSLSNFAESKLDLLTPAVANWIPSLRIMMELHLKSFTILPKKPSSPPTPQAAIINGGNTGLDLQPKISINQVVQSHPTIT